MLGNTFGIVVWFLVSGIMAVVIFVILDGEEIKAKPTSIWMGALSMVFMFTFSDDFGEGTNNNLKEIKKLEVKIERLSENIDALTYGNKKGEIDDKIERNRREIKRNDIRIELTR